MPLGLTSANHSLHHLLGSPVDAEVREHYRVLDLAASARDDVARLSSPAAVSRAQGADLDALADALTAGEPDPGSTHEGARLTALAAAQRRVAALAVAVDRSYAAVLDAVATESPEWLSDLASQRTAASARVSASVTDLAASLDVVDLTTATERFVSLVATDGDLNFRTVRGPERGRLVLDRSAVAVDGGLASVSVDVVLAALANYTSRS